MQTKMLSPTVAVAPQITAADVAALVAAGFRSLICNRPDGEGADQPGFEEIERAARDAGLEAVYLPVVSGKVTDEDAAHFGALLDRLPKPVLAYCRTGTRSTTLWALTAASRGRALPEIVAFTATGNLRSQAVMDRVGMSRCEDLDFDHPALPKGHTLERHVVWVARAPH